jgi:hypothetical protein
MWNASFVGVTRSAGGSTITQPTLQGTSGVTSNSYTNALSTISWTDGSAGVTGTNVITGIFADHVTFSAGLGLTFRVSADTSLRKISVLWEAFSCNARITFSASDASSTTNTTNTTGANGVSQAYESVALVALGVAGSVQVTITAQTDLSAANGNVALRCCRQRLTSAAVVAICLFNLLGVGL